MKAIPLVLGVGAYMAAVMYASCYLFGRSVGTWVGIATLGATYLALKLYTDWQERLLRHDVEQLTLEQQQEFIQSARDLGVLGDKKGT